MISGLDMELMAGNGYWTEMLDHRLERDRDRLYDGSNSNDFIVLRRIFVSYNS